MTINVNKIQEAIIQLNNLNVRDDGSTYDLADIEAVILLRDFAREYLASVCIPTPPAVSAPSFPSKLGKKRSRTGARK